MGQTEQPPLISIGELARRTACAVETVRYYERIGLLPAPQRSPGGHRLYRLAQVKRLTFVRRARELGFKLKEIRELLALVDGDSADCGQVFALTSRHLRDVEGRLAHLDQLRDVLNEMMQQCAGGTLPACPIVDALYHDGNNPPDKQGT